MTAFNKNLDFVKTYGSERVYLEGAFPTNAALDPVAASVVGGWFTVLHTATGKYTMTFKDAIAMRPRVFTDLQMGTPDGSYADIGAFVAATATAPATLAVETRNAGGTLADIPANANNLFHVLCAFTATSVPRP